MELREIIALTKSWWWLVLGLTVGAWFASYFIYDQLPIGSGTRVYSSSAQFELPRDPLRIVAFGDSASAKRIYIDSSTELAHLTRKPTKQSAAEYFTLISAALEAADEETFTEDDYESVLIALEDQIVAGLPADDSEVFPQSHIGTSTHALLAKAVDELTKDATALKESVAANYAAIPKYETLHEDKNRVVTLVVKGVKEDALDAQVWADSLVLAASRESFRRILENVETATENFRKRLKVETAPLNEAEKVALIARADGLLDSIRERSMQLRQQFMNDDYRGTSSSAAPISYPTFSEDNAVTRVKTFYQRLSDRISAAYPSVVADSFTATPVGSLENEQYTSARSRANQYRRELSRVEALMQELSFEQEQFDAEFVRYTQIYKEKNNTEEYVPNKAVVSSSEMTKARKDLDDLIADEKRLSELYQPAHVLMLQNRREQQRAITRWIDACDAAFAAQSARLATRYEKANREHQDAVQLHNDAVSDAAGLRERRYLLVAMANVFNRAKTELESANRAIEAASDYQNDLGKARDEQSPVIRVFSFSSKASPSAASANAEQVASVVAFIVLAGSLMMLYMLTLARNKVTTEFDVRKHINLPVLSKLPRRPDADRSLLDISPRSAFAEQFSTLATLVRSYAKELSLRSILVTSAVKEEGKTDIACNLSIALARKGLKVLLIDADYHRSMVEKFFHLTITQGSMRYVEDPSATDLAPYVMPTAAEGLDVLAPGGTVADPVRLLESERYRTLLKQAESEYDLVIVDSPPVARVGDALILASEVDATAFVVSSGDVSFADAALAKRLLTNVQANMLGVILNNSKDTRAREYYNYYYEGTRRRVRRVVD